MSLLGGVGDFIGDVATYGAVPFTGGASLLAKKKVRNAAGELVDVADDVSGAGATQDALNQQMQGAKQAQGAVTEGYQQGQGLLSPYQQGATQNVQNLMNGVNTGIYNPQYQSYQGPASSGQQAPGYGGYQGQMSSGQQAPAYNAFNAEAGKTANLGAFGLNGQSFDMPQQFQRQEATAENIQKFANPYLDQIIQKGTSAIENSAAGRGLLGSSATLNKVGDWASTAAQNNFNDAFSKFENAQNAGMGDFQDKRNFNADQLGAAYGRASGDRSFGAGQNSERNAYGMQGANFNQGAFEGDRAAGMNNSQFGANYGMQGAQFNQGVFEGDRAYGSGANQDMNNFNMQSGLNRYNMQNGLVNMGYNAAGAGANLSANYGQNMADIYTGMGNMQGAATMTQSNQRRGLFGDAIDLGFRVNSGAAGLFGMG